MSVYAKIKDGQVVQYPYFMTDLYAENPHTNYDSNINLVDVYLTTESARDGSYLVSVNVDNIPTYDPRTQNQPETVGPRLVNGNWEMEWKVTPLTQDQLNTITVAKAAEVRTLRDELLQRTDWTQLADLSTNTKLADTLHIWNAYRQALRDVPGQPGFPWDITWPDLGTIATTSK